MNDWVKNGFFITGTDTGVGKTLVSLTLLQLFKQKGFKTMALKPIASGCENLRNDDAILLQSAITAQVPYSYVNPFAFPEPIAPNIAAINQSEVLSVSNILKRCELGLTTPADLIIIEGVGGWKVPLNSKESTVDLAKAFGYPIILVIGLRLGCLNHSLLTIDHLQSSELNIAGWIANAIEPNFTYLDENIKTLQEWISTPLLGIIPHQSFINPHVSMQYLNVKKIFTHLESSHSSLNTHFTT